jgi:hypothetical protein
LINPKIKEEVAELMYLIESQRNEIAALSQQVESNPLLAAKHARVKELELTVKEL